MTATQTALTTQGLHPTNQSAEFGEVWSDGTITAVIDTTGDTTEGYVFLGEWDDHDNADHHSFTNDAEVAQAVEAARNFVARTIAETEVEVARRDGTHGAARVYDIRSDITDYGPTWETSDDGMIAGAEARYGYTTTGYITTIGAGGAILSRNVDGNSETTWFEECPAWNTSELAKMVRAEHAEYGRDPFAEDDR